MGHLRAGQPTTKPQSQRETQKRATLDMTTPQQVNFTNAFNVNRTTLALFASCSTKDELHIIRDAFFLGMASRLCPEEYEALRTTIMTDQSAFGSIASSIKTPKALESMVTAARAADGWQSLMDSLHAIANAVGSDLDGIWMGLETGRLEWLGAASAAHPLKLILKKAIKDDDKSTERDVVDAKMIWMYALSLSIPSLSDVSEAWKQKVDMEDKMNPLKGFDRNRWDCRLDEWRPLDLGVQEAAERGGSSFLAAWDA